MPIACEDVVPWSIEGYSCVHLTPLISFSHLKTCKNSGGGITIKVLLDNVITAV